MWKSNDSNDCKKMQNPFVLPFSSCFSTLGLLDMCFCNSLRKSDGGGQVTARPQRLLPLAWVKAVEGKAGVWEAGLGAADRQPEDR